MKVSMDAMNSLDKMEDYDRIASKHSQLMVKVKEFKKQFSSLEQENERLKADVAMLRNLMLELKHLTVATGWLATYRHDFETAISKTEYSDAWLKERDAKAKVALMDLLVAASDGAGLKHSGLLAVLSELRASASQPITAK